jgi:hypothetical protein
MEHTTRSLLHHPNQLFDGRIFFPRPDTIAWSDNLFIFAPVYAFFWFITGQQSITAYNMTAFLAYTFVCITTFVLFKKLLQDWRAAFVASFLFGFSLIRTASVPHFQLNGIAFVLLGLYFLIRYFEERNTLHAVLYGLTLTAAFWSATYYFLFFLIFSIIMIGWWLIFSRKSALSKKTLKDFAIAGILCAITIVPTLPPYLRVQHDLHTARSNGSLVIAGWRALFRPPPSALYDWLGVGTKADQRRLFPGLLTMIFVLFAIAAMTRFRKGNESNPANNKLFRKYIWPFSLSALAAIFIMQGTVRGVFSLPFRALRLLFPGWRSIRELSRFWIFPELVLCLLAGYGIAFLFSRMKKQTTVAILTVILIAAASFELLVRTSEVPIDTTAKTLAVNKRLAKLPAGAVIDYPVPGWPYSNYAIPTRQLRALVDNHPRYIGYSGLDAPEFLPRITLTDALPNPNAIAQVQKDGVRYVIVYGGEDCDGKVTPAKLAELQSSFSSVPGVETQKIGDNLLVTLPKDLVASPLPAKAFSTPQDTGVVCRTY